MKPKDEPFFVSREHPTSFGLVKEPKQVPVAWTSKRDLFQMIHAKSANVVVCEKDRVHTEPLYTSPPPQHALMAEHWKEQYEQMKAQRQWVGLTLDEKHHLNDILNLDGRFPVIDAIEAKLKEKNT